MLSVIYFLSMHISRGFKGNYTVFAVNFMWMPYCTLSFEQWSVTRRVPVRDNYHLFTRMKCFACAWSRVNETFWDDAMSVKGNHMSKEIFCLHIFYCKKGWTGKDNHDEPTSLQWRLCHQSDFQKGPGGKNGVDTLPVTDKKGIFIISLIEKKGIF